MTVVSLRRMWGGRKESQSLPSSGISEAGRVKAVQVALIRVGIPVRLSGVMDTDTRNGIRFFQRSKGLPETGFLDRETVDLLKAMVKERRRMSSLRKSGSVPPHRMEPKSEES